MTIRKELNTMNMEIITGGNLQDQEYEWKPIEKDTPSERRPIKYRHQIEGDALNMISGGALEDVLPSLMDDDGIVHIDTQELIKYIRPAGLPDIHIYKHSEPEKSENFIAKFQVH